MGQFGVLVRPPSSCLYIDILPSHTGRSNGQGWNARAEALWSIGLNRRVIRVSTWKRRASTKPSTSFLCTHQSRYTASNTHPSPLSSNLSATPIPRHYLHHCLNMHTNQTFMVSGIKAYICRHPPQHYGLVLVHRGHSASPLALTYTTNIHDGDWSMWM